MVFGLLALVGTVPLTATSVLALQSQTENAKNDAAADRDEDWKGERCHMRCRATARTPEDRKELFKNSLIVLCGGRLYVELSTYEGPAHHPFTGYYLPFPKKDYEGIVSTISNDPPQLNWVYLDTDSDIFQLSHGLRVDAEEGQAGPWDARFCSNGEKRYTFEGWEGFIAVETEGEPGLWRLCFDKYNDGLKGKIREGQRTVELELVREEIEG